MIAVAGLALSISLTANAWTLAAWLVRYGIDVGMATAQLTSVILEDGPVAQSGRGSGLQSTMRHRGSARGGGDPARASPYPRPARTRHYRGNEAASPGRHDEAACRVATEERGCVERPPIAGRVRGSGVSIRPLGGLLDHRNDACGQLPLGNQREPLGCAGHRDIERTGTALG